MKVFCYGSNMSSKRLKTEDRCPGAKFLCTAFIEQYVFKFNKKSTLGIGSGKGNIIFTGNSADIVWGIIFEIPEKEEKALDEAEGLGKGGYEKQSITVKNKNEDIDVIVYIAINSDYVDDTEKPFDWYKNHCIKGAIEFDLSTDYVKFLESFESKKDKNTKRSEEEYSIYLNS